MEFISNFQLLFKIKNNFGVDHFKKMSNETKALYFIYSYFKL